MVLQNSVWALMEHPQGFVGQQVGSGLAYLWGGRAVSRIELDDVELRKLVKSLAHIRGTSAQPVSGRRVLMDLLRRTAAVAALRVATADELHALRVMAAGWAAADVSVEKLQHDFNTFHVILQVRILSWYITRTFVLFVCVCM
jgi:hypothetical protein